MSEQKRKLLEEAINSLKQQRDELKLKMHLGSQELKKEWQALDAKLTALAHGYEPLKHALSETSEEVWESMKLVGEEIKHGFERVRKSL